MIALSVVALFTVPALAQWLGPDRSQPGSEVIMEEDFVTESGMTTTFGAANFSTAELLTRDFVAPAP